MDSSGMPANLTTNTPPWNEVLRAYATGDLHPSSFSTRVVLTTDRFEPRTIALHLEGGKRTVQLLPAFICPCGAIAYGGGESSSVIIDDLATSTGASKFIDILVTSMKQLRPELQTALDAHLRTVAGVIHAELMRRLCVQATRWNLPPYAKLGRSRARPAKCCHVA